MPRRLLVVATASVPAAALRTSVRAHAGEDAELLVVAPASDISRLDWLTNGLARPDQPTKTSLARFPWLTFLENACERKTPFGPGFASDRA